MSARSRQRAQGFTQVACAADQPFNLGMSVFPDRIRPDQQRTTGRRQSKTPATAFERLEIGRERRSVHREKGRDAAERRRLRPAERHQQRKLTVGKIERPQYIVEATRQCARRPVDMQAQAIVADQVRGGERQLIIFCAGV
jgi:hypothetical protein